MDFNDTQDRPSEDNSAAENTAYRGAGAGQKESPYADSPYYSNYQPPRQESQYDAQPSWAEQQKAAESSAHNSQNPTSAKPQKSHGGTGKRIAACTLAAALMVGACGVTAWGVNAHWEKETAAMQQSFQSQIEDLQKQIRKGPGVSGSSVSSDGYLSPSQVYAQNVDSVVAISNQVVANSWGGDTLAPASTGSGFVLTDDGYIISNCHVVEGADKLTVTTYQGEEYEATVIGYDKINDVSLLKVDAEGLQPVTIGSSDELSIGDMVVAIGNPLGELTSTQTVGYVSGKDRSVSTDGSVINMLQTDAAINPGNSGGPLFNMKGEVVGITTAKYSGSTPSGATIEGIGFAIPIDDVLGMIDDFKNYGYLKNQAYLGVKVLNMDPSTAAMYSLPSGAYVQSVNEGSSAEKAGVQPKDIIIGLGEYEVNGNSQLTSALRRFSAGDTTTITVFRAGEKVELSITFDEKPQEPDNAPSETLPGDMPSDGSYDEWYNYFAPYFGEGKNGN